MIKQMKAKYILALAICSFFAGIANYANAQDSTQSFGSYLVKTPWIVGVGFGYGENNGKYNPFNYKDKTDFYPGNVLIEKKFDEWKGKNKFVRGLGVQYVFGRQSLDPTLFIQSDINLKYSLNVLWGDGKTTRKWFDPYAVLGGGFTHMEYNFPYGGAPGTSYARNGNSIGWDYHLRQINLNFGAGVNFWVLENVGINLSAVAKEHVVLDGTNYVMYTAGLVFKIRGKCKEAPKVEEKKQPVSNYKRSKEEEDALIHLREHLNK